MAKIGKHFITETKVLFQWGKYSKQAFHLYLCYSGEFEANIIITTTVYGPLDFIWNYSGKPVPKR